MFVTVRARVHSCRKRQPEKHHSAGFSPPIFLEFTPVEDKDGRFMNRFASSLMVIVTCAISLSCGGGKMGATNNNELVSLLVNPSSVMLLNNGLVSQIVIFQIKGMTGAGQQITPPLSSLSTKTSNACVYVLISQTDVSAGCNASCGTSTFSSDITVTAPVAPGSTKTVSGSSQVTCSP
jgi:hypothetical protein